MKGASLQFRDCLLEPIREIFDVARLLDAAVTAHLMGEHQVADRLIRMADMPVIAEWTETLWGSTKAEVHRVRKIEGAPPFLAKGDRIRVRMPLLAEKRALIERDGWNCRFCGIPLIATEVRKRIAAAYPEALRWGARNNDQHAAFQCMWLQFDHVVPHSRGGDNSLANVVITCAPCNFGRNDWLLEEVGLVDPRTVPVQRTTWDGLERFQ